MHLKFFANFRFTLKHTLGALHEGTGRSRFTLKHTLGALHEGTGRRSDQGEHNLQLCLTP